MIPIALIQNRVKILLAVLLLASLLAGCRANIENTQPAQTEFIPLDNEQILGQSFTAHFNGLAAVGLIINPETAGRGAIRFSLYEAPGQETALRQVDIPLASFAYPALTYFRFPPISGSNLKDYFFSIEWKGDQAISVGAADGSAYPDGAAYLGLEPQDKQLTFDLNYGRRMMLIGLAQEMLAWLAFILTAIFLFCIPGWALLVTLYPGWGTLRFWTKLCLASGAGIAIYPILMLWTSLIGMKMGPAFAWLPPIVGIVTILIQNRGKLRIRTVPSFRLLLPSWSDAAMLIVVALVTLVRFWVIRSLPLPMWGDSYQHTVITQLIVDNGGLFKNWQPFADLNSFTYHFGFHSLAAAFHCVTQLSMAQSVLWTGQIVNILAVITLYPLALRLNTNPWSGVFAVLLAGLVFSMPMFYLNWGRYTQLTGLALLAVWAFLVWDFLDSHKIAWKPLILSSILLAGLALTHYRVLIFALVFLLAYLVFYFQRNRFASNLKQIIIICGIAFGLAIPWYIDTLYGRLWSIFSNLVTLAPSQRPINAFEINVVGDLFSYLPAWIWLALPVLIGLSIWKHQHSTIFITIWWLLLFLLANPQWLNLPGMGVLSTFAVMISLYFPASVIIGSSIGWLIDTLQVAGEPVNLDRRTSQQYLTAGLSVFLILVVVLAIIVNIPSRTREISYAEFSLATRPDVRAAEWMKQNLPADSKLLVNSFFAFNDTAIVGSDGGWWLPILANRQTNLPPLAYITEKSAQQDYASWTNSLTESIVNKGISHPDIIQELKLRGIKYLYIGQKQGGVNSTSGLLQPETLLTNPQFQPIYHQDRVWVFKLID